MMPQDITMDVVVDIILHPYHTVMVIGHQMEVSDINKAVAVDILTVNHIHTVTMEYIQVTVISIEEPVVLQTVDIMKMKRIPLTM
jgi:hypothetical protein